MQIAFIGLGNMGGPMAINLVKAGHSVKAFDLSQDAVAKVVAEGGQAAASAQDAVQGAEAIVTMLPASQHVEGLFLGRDGQPGLLGHSDADVLLHALTDALLGAAALGDIGSHFPDSAAEFRGADSMLLLVEALRRVRAAGWDVGNLDSTIIAQAPRLAAHIPLMRERITQALELQPGQLNIKAKTAERLGPVGQGAAIEARAVALLVART